MGSMESVVPASSLVEIAYPKLANAQNQSCGVLKKLYVEAVA